MTNILLGATGSVAAIKIPLLVSLFKKVRSRPVKILARQQNGS